MTKEIALAIDSTRYSTIKGHLFPGDGNEAAAILLCGRCGDRRLRLTVTDAILVHHDACRIRTSDQISWPGEFIERAIDRAERHDLSIFLIHSHPGGFFGFSAIDDESDLAAMPGLFEGASRTDIPHGSAVMIPDGRIRARIYNRRLETRPVNSVALMGDDLNFWAPTNNNPVMAFSSSMTAKLADLSACIVGVSGTGSLVAEMLARMGIGRLILVDFDHVEKKNLNRIVNAMRQNAQAKDPKVQMMEQAIRDYRTDVEIITVPHSIATREAVIAASDADILFSCVDSIEGRHICDMMAAAFIQPLIDVGVTIPTRTTRSGAKAIGDVCGRIDYVRPGGADLRDRGVVTPEGLRREYLARVAPEDLKSQVDAGYIKGMIEEAPSVMALNMRAASAGVMEFIARCFPFRHEPNASFSRTMFSLAAGEEEYFSEIEFGRRENSLLGLGLIEPLLNMPSLSLSAHKDAA